LDDELNEEKKWLSKASNRILEHSTVVYLFILTVSVYVCKFHHSNFVEILSPDSFKMPSVQVFILSLISCVILLCFNLLFETSSVYFRRQQILTAIYTRPLKFFGLAYIALLSSVGEEFFFRACLQPYLGIVLTSFLVSLLHLGSTFRVSGWTLYVGMRSLLFGVLFFFTGSLIPCLVVHFILNLCFLFRGGFLLNLEKISVEKN
tara:strand:- start:5078 stop:5692 length:615 start_codon:yes stop_codon:yes gene_type:complete